MSELRIIGGKARGRRIHSVPGDTTRPITDKVKEALFNIIGPDVFESNFLDLFAGSGSVGIEALSRGASSVTFVERNRQPYRVIKENLKLSGLQEGAQILQMDAFDYLEQSDHPQFDYVFIAPPQYRKMWSKALKALDQHITWLSPDAWVIVQIHPVEYQAIDDDLPLNNLVEFDQRHYGSTLLVFYRLRQVM
jgi:16S rRNA (guanine966-N2)-methyltransferase